MIMTAIASIVCAVANGGPQARCDLDPREKSFDIFLLQTPLRGDELYGALGLFHGSIGILGATLGGGCIIELVAAEFEKALWPQLKNETRELVWNTRVEIHAKDKSADPGQWGPTTKNFSIARGVRPAVAKTLVEWAPGFGRLHPDYVIWRVAFDGGSRATGSVTCMDFCWAAMEVLCKLGVVTESQSFMRDFVDFVASSEPVLVPFSDDVFEFYSEWTTLRSVPWKDLTIDDFIELAGRLIATFGHFYLRGEGGLYYDAQLVRPCVSSPLSLSLEIHQIFFPSSPFPFPLQTKKKVIDRNVYRSAPVPDACRR